MVLIYKLEGRRKISLYFYRDINGGRASYAQHPGND
jgi:hypothetical protein